MKKLISLVLVLILCLSVAVTGSAETASDTKIRQLLARLDIMVGDSDGNFYPENPVTRAEFIKVAIMASPYRDAVPETSSTSPFGDVPYTLWSAPYIALGADSGLISGYPDSTFRPDNTVLLEEGVTICLKLLGYTEADYGKVWPSGPMSLARSLELLENMDKSTGDTLLRKDVMQLIYNTLNTKMKGSPNELISVPGYTYMEDTVIIATREQDKSIGKDRVLTSAGTFKTEDEISSDMIGQKGDAFIKNGDTLTVFVPYTQTQTLHTVYSVINSDILIHENGSSAVLDADGDSICHSGKTTATLASLSSTFKTGDILRVIYDADGDLDYLVHEKDNLNGPYVVYSDNWMVANGIDTTASVIRNGKTATLSDITLHDLVYYSKQMNMVWAYNDRITGTYEKAIPNQDAPTSVVISGNTLAVETGEAFAKLAAGGSVKLGDTITVLIGRNGGIAEILTGDTQTVQHGLLVETGTKSYITQSNNTEYAYYAKLITADGTAIEVRTDKDYKDFKNYMVIASTASGATKLSRVSQSVTDLNGEFDADKMMLDGKKVSQDVKILDIIGYGNSGKTVTYGKIFPQQINGTTLSNRNIASISYNEKGEIAELFLEDASGDLWSYGVLTDTEKNNMGMSVSGRYTININGTEQTFSTASNFAANQGVGVKFSTQNGTLTTLTALTKVNETVKSFDERYMYAANGEKIALGKGLVAYKRIGAYSHEYQLISTEDIDLTQGSVQCYKNNNKIRVIIWTLN